MGDLTKNFSSSEFECPCCGMVNVSPILVRKLEILRVRVGKPITITSGCRCWEHNKDPKVGGVSTSSHLKGVAADIYIKNDEYRFLLLSQIFRRETWWSHSPLFNRVGIGSNFIHVDIDSSKNKDRSWTY